MGKESYHVLARLPDRGASEVFLARVGERTVVLERLPRARAVDPDVVGTFLEKARVSSQLGHPNVAQVVDVGRLGSTYYVALEYADGELLRAIVDHARAQGKLQVPLRAVLTIAAGAVIGLSHAHERKDADGKTLEIVHGNLSPSRILVTREGTIKLLDFGLPSGASSEPAELPYRSPEQVRDDAIDGRSDLFSLGAILWELLTREPLFKRASSADTISAIETEYPAAPSTVRLDVPPELDSIVLKLLAKAPSARYQSADDVLVDIEALATKLGFLISTTDLSRMMRLWFGAKPDVAKLESDIVVAGVHLETEVAPGAPSPIDDLLDKVMTIAPAATPQPVSDERSNRSTVPTGEQPAAPRESFEQIRDRILGARDNKDTKSPRSKAYTRPMGTPLTPDASASSAGPFGMSPTAITDVISRVTKASAATGAATRDSIAKASANGEAPDKVVVDMDAIADRPKTEDGPNGEPKTAVKAEEELKEAPRVKTPTARPISEPSAETPATKASDVAAEIAMARTTSTEHLNEAPRAKEPTARPMSEPRTKTPNKPSDVASEIAMARTSSTEWFERGEREAREAHARHAGGHHHDDHDHDHDHKSTAHSHHDMHPRRPAWLIPVLGAAIVVVVVLAIVRMAGRETAAKTYGSNVAQAKLDAAAAPMTIDAAVAAVPIDAEVAAVPIDAAEVAAVPIDAAQVAAVPVDAAEVAPVPVDAAKVAAVPVDAAQVASLPVDAAVKTDRTTTTDRTTKTDKTDKTDKTTKTDKTDKTDKTTKTDKTDKTDKPPKTEDKPLSVEDAFASGDFGKTNAACAKNTRFNSQILEMCATAACQVKDTALATRWLHALPRATREPMMAKCKDLGVEINIP